MKKNDFFGFVCNLGPTHKASRLRGLQRRRSNGRTFAASNLLKTKGITAYLQHIFSRSLGLEAGFHDGLSVESEAEERP